MRMHRASLADLGLLHAQAHRDQIGFVAPTLLYTQMRAIDASAQSLRADFARNVDPRHQVRLAYEDWFDRVWQPFFTKTTGSLGAKLGNVFFTDDLQKQIDARRLELDGFYHQYGTLTMPGGQPVPPPSSPGVPEPSSPSPETPSPGWIPSFVPKIQVPWYVWVGLGAGVVGGSYWLYKTFTRANLEAKEAREALFSSKMFAARDALPAACPTCHLPPA